nr:zinc-type alcohol dehydrogenase-like protein c16a3.02c [Quercus suber]
MASFQTPEIMRAAQLSSNKGGIEQNIRIQTAPIPARKSDQHLIQVVACSLNPIDYKGIEWDVTFHYTMKKPVIPSSDIVGRIVEPADGSSLQPGQLVFGGAGFSPMMGAAMAEYTVAGRANVVALPEGVDPIDASTIWTAASTAYQSIVPWVREGSKVFINGGSGGCGIFGIQIAKAKGCHVTTTCSSANVELCKSLGADEVIDYRKEDVIACLVASGKKYDHVVDNVGEQLDFYWRAHDYTTPQATFVAVGLHFTFKSFYAILARKLWPGFFGGGKRKEFLLICAPKEEELIQMRKWLQNGQLRPVIDSTFKFEDVTQAFEKLKTGRVKGKIVVELSSPIDWIRRCFTYPEHLSARHSNMIMCRSVNLMVASRFGNVQAIVEIVKRTRAALFLRFEDMCVHLITTAGGDITYHE